MCSTAKDTLWSFSKEKNDVSAGLCPEPYDTHVPAEWSLTWCRLYTKAWKKTASRCPSMYTLHYMDIPLILLNLVMNINAKFHLLIVTEKQPSAPPTRRCSQKIKVLVTVTSSPPATTATTVTTTTTKPVVLNFGSLFSLIYFWIEVEKLWWFYLNKVDVRQQRFLPGRQLVLLLAWLWPHGEGQLRHGRHVVYCLWEKCIHCRVEDTTKKAYYNTTLTLVGELIG